MSLKIAVIGSGGREHALVESCLQSPNVSSVVAIPGNGGMEKRVACINISVESVEEIVAYAKVEALDLVICGPEVPLSLGLANALNAAGIPCYGPEQAGAELEASKAFCKDFLQRYAVPTAAYGTFSEVSSALEFLETQSFPIVIKASGLAAGKGVIIAQTHEEAVATVKDMLEGGQFGESGSTVVIEEFMDGKKHPCTSSSQTTTTSSCPRAKTTSALAKAIRGSIPVAWALTHPQEQSIPRASKPSANRSSSQPSRVCRPTK